MDPEHVPPVPPTRRDTSRRFTDAEVYELRRRYLDGETKSALAAEFGVSLPTVSDAIHGLQTYKNV